MKLIDRTQQRDFVAEKSDATVGSSAWLFGVLLTLVIIASFWLRLVFLKNMRWTYDEGIHVLFVQMLERGYRPYSEVFVSYPPLYTLTMDWTWRLFGTVESLQILMSVFTMVGLLAVGLMAWRLGGLWAGLLAPIFMSLEPEFFRGSRAVLTEIPSISLAALSIAFAAFYLWSDTLRSARLWLAASGVALIISLMLKILSPYVIGLIGLMILARQLQMGMWPNQAKFWREIMIDSLIWGIAFTVPLLILISLYDLPGMIEQAVLFRFASRDAYEGEINNFLFMLSFLRDNWVITLFAIIGLWPLSRRLKQSWFVLVWFLLAVMFTLIQVPLRDKHLPILLPPLAIMAGLGAAWLIETAWTSRHQRRLAGLVSAGLVVGLLGVYVWQTGQVYAAIRHDQTEYLNSSKQVLVDFITRFTAPDDCLITDDPTLAFVANRPVPPPLAETSSARLRSGDLTEAMLIDIAAQTDCQLVAPTEVRFKRTTPGFIEWAKGHYLGLWLYDQETEILIAKPLTQPRPATATNIQLGDQVELAGYDLTKTEEGAVYLSLYWRPLRPFEQDFTVFVHVRDLQNNTVINADHQPYDGRVPTSRWPVGQTIKETIRLDIPPDLPTGQYQIMTGLYSPITVERLPVINDASGENAVIIPLVITP
ncbi:MAG TPA: hypothetical protein P5526_23270 [Anaerolineae bacterium]|nr:hypothetical protein [Anaerolineae bacterium]